jgi:tellurite resistance protein
LLTDAELVLRVQKLSGLIAGRRYADGAERGVAQALEVEGCAGLDAEAAVGEGARVDLHAGAAVNLFAEDGLRRRIHEAVGPARPRVGRRGEGHRGSAPAAGPGAGAGIGPDLKASDQREHEERNEDAHGLNCKRSPRQADKFSASVGPMALAPRSDGATAAMDRLVGVLGEDAIFVLASGGRDPKDALDSLLLRRGQAYAAALQARPHTRMTTQLDAWMLDMLRAMAPVSPPAWMPMMDVVREKVTLELGARGLRSLFSNKPSDKDVARVKRYGTLAVRALRAVFAADGPLDREEQTTIAGVVAALGLPEANASALCAESPVAPDALDVHGEGTSAAEPRRAPHVIDHAVARAVVRGGWLAAALDEVDPREEQVVRAIAHKLNVSNEDVEDGRRQALALVDARRKTGVAAIDGVRYVLGDRSPGLGVQLAVLAGTLMLPRRWRGEALAPVAHGAPVALARRHGGLHPDERFVVLGVVWAAALVDDPTAGRKALLRARWERFAQDLGEDDPSPRALVDRWMDDALAGVARTLE